jgi:hypothetical protein
LEKNSDHLREDQRDNFREISDLEAIHEIRIRKETEEVFVQEQEEREREREMKPYQSEETVEHSNVGMWI